MDEFVFKGPSPVLVPDIPGESQLVPAADILDGYVTLPDIAGESLLPQLEAIWGTNGTAMTVPGLEGVVVDPDVPTVTDDGLLFG